MLGCHGIQLALHLCLSHPLLTYAVSPAICLYSQRLPAYPCRRRQHALKRFGYDPWFCLGNIKREPLAVILARFENNDTPGLRTVYTVPPQDLVRKYGQFDRQRVYGSTNDLLTLYVAKHCGQQLGTSL